MLNLLLSLVGQEQPNAILEQRSFSYKDLQGLEVLYIKDGKYHLAQSICTECWIAPKLAELHRRNLYIGQKFSLSEASNIEVFNSLSDIPKSYRLTESKLKKLYLNMESSAETFAYDILRRYIGLIYRIKLCLLPSPCIVVTLARNSNFLGSLLLKLDGNCEVLSSVDEFVLYVCKDTNTKNLLSPGECNNG